ncbi:prolyl aminopeptidase [Telmatospirillum sp.]|uniref:prolyl aminopeptidase n=1 Tax=Telmatospirillum sp. TaxID=2079197 RepID=UPI002848F2D5|nr:prolyl aminopeptidase [Telmatospirillum sp.]MDR3440250.1 prolyl aminopeptidase [Telmatospirillum sp.]
MKGDKETAGELYPPLEPNHHGWLTVDSHHRLYWEESGNPDGLPVVFLHGGPGAGCASLHRRFFDPRRYRIVLFDQRGAGRSAPAADVSNNTTPLLIQDIETLRSHLRIERWLVFGGSWGSTLALAYGETHPDRCLGFILRGIFLFRPQEVDWFLHQMGRFFPEAGRRFRDYLPPDEQTDLLASYYRRLTDPSPAVHMPAAQIWCAYEESCSRLLAEPGDTRPSPAALAMARIEAHYMAHAGFLEENQLLRDIHRLRKLPATIVQGRYDMVCPIASADDLAQAWPEATFQVIPDAGHSAMEPGVRAALVAATNRYRTLG